MKFCTLQIVWHERQPVFTIEFLLSDVFATGGADNIVRVRLLLFFPFLKKRFVDLEGRLSKDRSNAFENGMQALSAKGSQPSAHLISELSGPSGNVNVIRLCPTGPFLVLDTFNV